MYSTLHYSCPTQRTEEHGPNFNRPPPDLIDGEEEYEVETIISQNDQGKRIFISHQMGRLPGLGKLVANRYVPDNAQEILDNYRRLHSL